MTTPDALAEQLLDAQVEFILDELSGDRLHEVISEITVDVLAVADTMIVSDVIDVTAVKQTARVAVDRIGGSAMVEDMVAIFADAVYDASANEKHHLGDVIDRDSVSDLVQKFLEMHTLHDLLLERLTESPLVANVASRFVNKLVTDFMQSSRERAERVPGVASVLSMGQRAAARMRSTEERHFLGDLAGRSAQFALRRTNNAIKELIRDAPLHGAAMEIWDLHADEPVSGLRDYLSQAELRDLIVTIYAIVEHARNTDYLAEMIDEGIDAFFDHYGHRRVAELLPEIGLDGETVAAEISRYAPEILEAAKANGVLAGLVRERLAPFFRSERTLTLLASARDHG
ncbi:hypothetical protein FOS14_13570 [Skermania sp. ID1734]|uniref:hypothetical protein n=1 Tax=Skermania sp. ID1734 TaxID=2597516 RepID=UPI00117CD517|nr:hypothetical protein [Skermania sp. ID1734]TSD98027.1 hypothetical protein FOS14_13570 [Skermania sp. ID1734]